MSCVSTDRRALTTNAGSGPPGTLGPHAGRLAPESARAAQVAAQLVEAGVEVGAAALACELHRHDLLTQGQQVLFDLLKLAHHLTQGVGDALAKRSHGVLEAALLSVLRPLPLQ